MYSLVSACKVFTIWVVFTKVVLVTAYVEKVNRDLQASTSLVGILAAFLDYSICGSYESLDISSFISKFTRSSNVSFQAYGSISNHQITLIMFYL